MIVRTKCLTPVRAVPALSITLLCAVNVAAGADAAIDEVVVTGKFIGERQTGMKLDVPVADVPFSLSNYTNDFMNEIDAVRIGDIYQYMTGINRANKGGYGMSIRGFTTTGGDRSGIMMDGLPGVAGRFGSPPTAGIERVEVFRGPASVLYGRAAPGGFVNLISKKPSERAATSVDLRATSYSGGGVSLGDANGYDVMFDSTGPIDSQNRFLYRLVAQYYDTDSFRNGSTEKATYASPSVTWNVSDATALTLQLEYHHEKSSYDDWLVAPNLDIRRVADIRTRYQEDDSFGYETTRSATVTLSHSFSRGATLNVKARTLYYDQDTNANENNVVRADLQTLGRRDTNIVNEREYHFIDAGLNLQFATGFIEHNLLIGLSGGIDIGDFDRRQFYTAPARPNALSRDVNLYNPILDAFAPSPRTPNSHRHNRVKVAGAYLSDLMTLSEHWKAVLGIRYDRESDEFHEKRLTTPDSSKTVSEVLPMGGLVYQPNDVWSFYGSYSTSFRPPSTTVIDINGVNSFKPETGNQVEVGAKATLFDDRLSATLALYRLNREDGIAPAGSGPFGNYQEQVGSERSEGFEVEVSAQPLDNWSFTAGYAHANAKVTDDLSAFKVGARLLNSPRDSAHIWSRYDIAGGPLEGLGFGVGIVYMGDRVATFPTATRSDVLQLPSYETLDLALYYALDTYDFTLKVNNVLDDVYYVGANNPENVIPGAPRFVSLSFRKNF